MNSTIDVTWWGTLLQWQAGPTFDQTTITYDGANYAVGIADVPNYHTPLGAHRTDRMWCLADPATGLPGAVLSERRYVARILAEAALTEAVAAGRHVSEVVDRIDGIPSLLAVLDTAPSRPTPIAAWLVAAVESHRSRIRITAGHGETVADIMPVWSEGPVPVWHVRYAAAPRPEPVTAPSWIAAAGEVVAATATAPDANGARQ